MAAAIAISAHSQEPNDSIRTKELNEIVVTATREVTRIDGDGMLTTIQGTELQNIGTAKDALGYIP